MTPEDQSEQPDGFDDLLGNVKALAEQIRELQELGVAQYTPVVKDIIASCSRDTRHIEHTLDRLLDFACTSSGLALFKSLCRYYFTIDPAATADYINFYRKMWDSEETEERT